MKLPSIVCVLVCLSLTSAVIAEEPATRAVREKPDTPFVEGARAFTLTGGYQFERTGEDIYLVNTTFSYDHYVYDYVAIGVQGVAYYGYEDEPALGAGLNIMARWHFLNYGKWSMYGDLVGGLFQLDENFPEGGTHFNFTYQAGVGMSLGLTDDLYLMGGLKFVHVSNGFIEGRDRNPVFNSYGGYVGLMWMF
jgi:hypothetical protein